MLPAVVRPSQVYEHGAIMLAGQSCRCTAECTEVEVGRERKANFEEAVWITMDLSSMKR